MGGTYSGRFSFSSTAANSTTSTAIGEYRSGNFITPAGTAYVTMTATNSYRTAYDVKSIQLASTSFTFYNTSFPSIVISFSMSGNYASTGVPAQGTLSLRSGKYITANFTRMAGYNSSSLIHLYKHLTAGVSYTYIVSNAYSRRQTRTWYESSSGQSSLDGAYKFSRSTFTTDVNYTTMITNSMWEYTTTSSVSYSIEI